MCIPQRCLIEGIPQEVIDKCKLIIEFRCVGGVSHKDDILKSSIEDAYLWCVGQVEQESRKTCEGDTVTESDDTSLTVDDMVTENSDMSVNVDDTVVNDFEDIDD